MRRTAEIAELVSGEVMNPELRELAAADVRETTYDLPIEINDSVISLLDRYSEGSGPPNDGSRSGTNGTLPPHDRKNLRRRGCAARFDLPGAGRKPVQTESSVAGQSQGDVAIHFRRAGKNTASVRTGGSTNVPIRRNPHVLPPGTSETFSNSSATGTWPWPPIIPAQAGSVAPWNGRDLPTSGRWPSVGSSPGKPGTTSRQSWP